SRHASTSATGLSVPRPIRSRASATPSAASSSGAIRLLSQATHGVNRSRAPVNGAMPLLSQATHGVNRSRAPINGAMPLLSRATRLLEKAVELGQVVHRLRLKPLRPRVHLAVEAADLRLDILGPGVQRRADAERGRQADAVTGRVQSLVHPLQDLDEADRVDV